MYTTITMVNLVNITEARNNLSKLISEVSENNRTVILIRESVPKAVLISYKKFIEQEDNWKLTFKEAMKEARKKFKEYLKREKIPYPKTEEEMYELTDKITGRHRQ